jgi:aminomethyltransferase
MEGKRTPLYELHAELGAKFVPFAGWQMPVQYTGVIDEHNAVRQCAGIFDVSHMGEIFVAGPEAEAALNFMTCNDVSVLTPGRAQYTALTTETGGIVDDIIIYKMSDDRFMLCVNASNADKDYAWLKKQNTFDANIENCSGDYAQIAVQGPEAIAIVQSILPSGETLEHLGFFTFYETTLLNTGVIIARTGYTGEDGVEIFISLSGGDQGVKDIWQALMESGTPRGMLPTGLGARDSLRLEACLPLHGHELSEDITAIESGLGWIVKPDKGDFIGKEILAQQKASGAPRSLIGFVIEDRGIARHGDKFLSASDEEIGVVTSGTKTPTVGKALGLALVASEHAEVGSKAAVEVRGRSLGCEIVKRPFYKRPKK